MTCHVCGSQFEEVLTNLPFKVGAESLVVLKNTPVLQCRNCPEYLLEEEGRVEKCGRIDYN
jgi:YgiT-type zinc finger domain-containing protein